MTLEEIKKLAIDNDACNAQLNKFIQFIESGDELSAWQTVLGNYFWLKNRGFLMPLLEVEKLAGGIGKLWHKYGYLLREESYKNGKFDGVCRSWYHDCNRLKSEYTYKDGVGHGLFRIWNDGFGLEAEFTYVDGKLNGLYRTWYRNGKLEEEVTYKDGQRDGVYRSWHEYTHGEPNPEIDEYKNYNNGVLEGLRFSKSEYGRLIFTNYYKNGKKVNKIFAYLSYLHYLYTNK